MTTNVKSLAHNLGYPRMGAARELKWALERYWKGRIEQDELLKVAAGLREDAWKTQRQAGLAQVPVGDFALYDHVLDHACTFGLVPERFASPAGGVDLDTYFLMARGTARDGREALALEMTKWFDTNYHYLVPELTAQARFSLDAERLLAPVREARARGIEGVRPVLLGPVTFLWLAKRLDGGDKLEALDALLDVYTEALRALAAEGVQWVQLDEPILVLDLPEPWRQALRTAHERLAAAGGPKRLLATYFGRLGDQLDLACELPVDALHVDATRGGEELERIAERLPAGRILSVGIVDGRNVWRTDLDAALDRLEPLAAARGELWVAPSCSLLHVPHDLAQETQLDEELRSWLAFARQKLEEVATLARALQEGREAVAETLAVSRRAIASRRSSERTRRPEVRERMRQVTPAMAERGPSAERLARQREKLGLPLLPTTTIGSFPQTPEIRRTRRKWRKGEIDDASYVQAMRQEIDEVVRRQEALGLDVLVHGEPERGDMVEYFGELLEGMAVTEQGWVQSYGSRCVKPPIVYGDVWRAAPMTVEWSTYAQSRTSKPMKGMLTGPVTILQWSFVRDDQPRGETCQQIALALRDEVADLEKAGIGVVQIDEPALREGLPLRREDWDAYLRWAVFSFRLAAAGASDETQVHTHMCYAEFGDILEAIVAMDADVITLEASRSRMEVLEELRRVDYPNEVGPGIYDVHSPRVPRIEEMEALLRQAARAIPLQRLWANPDCGLKTRGWEEVEAALRNMVEAARRVRTRPEESATAAPPAE